MEDPEPIILTNAVAACAECPWLLPVRRIVDVVAGGLDVEDSTCGVLTPRATCSLLDVYERERVERPLCRERESIYIRTACVACAGAARGLHALHGAAVRLLHRIPPRHTAQLH